MSRAFGYTGGQGSEEGHGIINSTVSSMDIW